MERHSSSQTDREGAEAQTFDTLIDFISKQFVIIHLGIASREGPKDRVKFTYR